MKAILTHTHARARARRGIYRNTPRCYKRGLSLYYFNVDACFHSLVQHTLDNAAIACKFPALPVIDPLSGIQPLSTSFRSPLSKYDLKTEQLLFKQTTASFKTVCLCSRSF